MIHCEHGWWFPEREGPDYGIWESNANLLTDNRGPFDPQMGTYQLRGLLCRVSKLRPEDDHFGPPPLDDDDPVAGTRRIAASPCS